MAGSYEIRKLCAHNGEWNMAVIYVKEQGAYIKKLSERIIVEKNNMRLAEIQVQNITDLSIIGNVQITTQALHMLMDHGIDISFFSYSGNYLGQISSESSKNIFLRFSQYELYQDLEKRLEIARTIVMNKIENQIRMIRNFNWKDVEYDYRPDVKELKRLQGLLPDKKTSNEIMGIEGSCSAVYFSCYGNMFKSDLKFTKRSKRPPRDPVNIILSLAYTLLTKEVTAALDSESFETYLGFLHGIRYGRKSLALDIVEEFRQPVVDRLVVTLFNKRMLGELDFETQEENIVLTEDGFKKFCREYEKWMKSPVSSTERRSFRNIIHAQAAVLKKSIRNKELYVPYQL